MAPLVTEVSPSESSSTALRENALMARELEWAKNSEELLAKHAEKNKLPDGSGRTIVRTRFPPEPNGFLHIGHAKSMNMNFRLAFEKLGVPPECRRTIFRYDDTNPEAETEEYVDSLRRDLEWLGWKPETTTYSSDQFQTLYDLAVQLIKKGLAYACNMNKKEVEAQRELALNRVMARNAGKDPDVEFPLDPKLLPGPNRNTSPERNSRIFENMRRGMYQEGEWTLRLKMDMESANPNMYDLMAYRIKYTPHPHSGDQWCIYPMYDWTHGICDSLEDIDYSICTLEFETRREPYYWILWALDMYRPKVYEMSRLNLQYTVLSKRRLLKLVNKNYVRDWSDPRMPTISGLRRRGYTPEIINSFCNDVGATRAMNVVEMEKLFQCARQVLAPTSRRAMVAMNPIIVEITNFEDAVHEEEPQKQAGLKVMEYQVPNSPTDDSMGSHTVTLTKTLFIDSSDFRLEDEADYYGLAPNKAVGLKFYGGNLICDEVVFDSTDQSKIKLLKCRADKSEGRPKPKTYITWVPSDGIKCEVRVYNHLFTVPEPSDLWEDEINPKSEVLYPNAVVDPSVKGLCDVKDVDKWKSNAAFQFERFGYFVVDTDTTYDLSSGQGSLVFNRTVSLKEEEFKKDKSDAEQAALEKRRAEQKAQLEAKEARMRIAPENLFREAAEFVGKYSQYDSEGIPTHDAEGEALTKSAMKTLKKEQVKHVKALAKAGKK